VIKKGKKYCKICKKTYPVNMFYKEKNSVDGYRCYCKKCFREEVRKYKEENKDKVSEYYKNYRKRNKERLNKYQKEYMKKYYKANKEKVREYQRKYCKKKRGEKKGINKKNKNYKKRKVI